MRTTNALTILAGLIWAALALLGRLMLEGVEAQRVSGYPSIAQIDWFIIGPLSVVSIILIAGWVGNLHRRFAVFQLGVVVMTLFAILPYLMIYGGGI